MSIVSVGSPSDLESFLKQHSSAAVVAVRHDASDDIAPSVVSLVAQARSVGRPAVVLAPDGPSAMRWRHALDEDGVASEVTSLRQAALNVIDGAGAGFSRAGRLLDGNELDILMEDLKVSGLRPGRLREMCKFFYKGIADGVSGDPDWLISAEENEVFGLLMDNLKARRALLDMEAYAVALEALETPEAQQVARALVPDGAVAVVPDFGTLSITGQRFARALTGDASLVALGCALNASNAEEDYPNPAGFTALCEEADALADVAAPERCAAVETAVAAHPAEEFDAVASAVAQAVADGIDPGDITVACPHSIWMNAIAQRLAEAGIPATVDRRPAKAKGDPREAERCGLIKTRALAKLLADPDDFTALRSWLGLGDWLVRSDAFSKLLSYARENGMSAQQAFETLMAMPAGQREIPIIDKFDAPYAQLLALREALANADGATACTLLEEAGCTLSESSREALAAREAFDAEAFASLVLADTEADPYGTVTVVPYRRAFGRHGKLTVIAGMVSGFLPALDATSDSQTLDHKRRAYDRDRLVFEAVKSTAADKVVLTRFTDDRIENADALSMEVSRIYLEGGDRYAIVAASPYITDTTPIPDLPTVTTVVGGAATL